MSSSDTATDADLLTVYRSMRPDLLALLVRAFTLDLQHARRDDLRAFCERRLALIQQVLEQGRA